MSTRIISDAGARRPASLGVLVCLVVATLTLTACGSESGGSSSSAGSDQAAIEARIARERKEAAAEAIRDREVKELRDEVKRLKAKRAKPSQPATAAPSTQSSAPTASPTTGSTTGSWPPNDSAWTVILASEDTADGATQAARRATDAGLPGVGLLYSSDFRTLRPGWHVAYSGQFSSKEEAMSRAAQARAAGFSDAYQRYVSAQ